MQSPAHYQRRSLQFTRQQWEYAPLRPTPVMNNSNNFLYTQRALKAPRQQVRPICQRHIKNTWLSSVHYVLMNAGPYRNKHDEAFAADLLSKRDLKFHCTVSEL